MSSFLHPWVLLGLPLAAVPLILHLIQRRDPPTVEFPAVRYLVQVTQEHQRRLRLRHWLLLLIRALLILALVLAAAGPSAPLREAVSHTPSALVLVVDNSPSSGVIVAGAPRLAQLRTAAHRVLERTTPSDALWLLTSDGVARRGTPADLLAAVDSLQPTGRRMDLGEAVTTAGDVLRSDSRPGSIVVLTDLQATALSPAPHDFPVVVARAAEPAPPNIGLARVDAGAQPWTPEGGAVTVALTGDSGTAPVSVVSGDGPARQALVAAGGAGRFELGGAVPGWWVVRASKAPDELRSDDEALALVRVAPVARVAWDPGDRYVSAVCDVLESSGRLRRGAELNLGSLGPGLSIVVPPVDPAALGSLNRQLERRGAAWRFGALVTAPGVSDSGALTGREQVVRRYTLEPLRPSAAAGVLATVGGAPWVVRTGDVVLLGSRLDPSWTGLPLSARFVSFMDAMINRIARGQLALLSGAPGDAVLLPDLVTDVAQGEHRWVVEGGAAFHPPAAGAYFLLSGSDTVGGLSVNLDPRESALAPASEDQVETLWEGSRVVRLGQAPGAAFAGAGRASLQGPLLWLALLLALVEVALASGLGRAR
ncbi:MAG: BatA domain-containing protein [Gemmatimonadota bacterium]